MEFLLEDLRIDQYG